MALADLDTLHALLGHYARQRLDIQKMRVAMNNRVSAMERDGLPEQWTAVGADTVDGLEALERSINAQLTRLAKQHFMSDWIAAQKGIGLPGFALLLGITGPLDKFATISKLWKYLGLHVVDGRAPKRERGQKLAFSPQGRVLCHQIGEAIVKVGAGGEWRAHYDRKKREYLERERLGLSGCPTGQLHKDANGKVLQCVKGEDGAETSAHIHSMALRYAVKMLLKELWKEWHRRQAMTQMIAYEGVPAA